MRYTLILLALLGASCSSTLPSVKPYHLDVQQGNVVTAKMMLQLKPGMTKSQVRYVLGTPLLQDSFHQNRWDYFYQMAKGGKVIERRRIILDFEDDGLKAVRGDVIPAGAPGAEEAAIAAVTDLKTVKSDKTLLQEDPKTSWYDRFKFWDDGKDKTAKAMDEEKPKAKAAVNETSEKSWYDSLKFWGDDEKTGAKPSEPAASKALPAKKAIEQKAAEQKVEQLAIKPSSADKTTALEKASEAVDAPSVEVAKANADSAADAKAALKETVDQVAEQPQQLAKNEVEEPSNYQEAVAKAVNAWANAWRTKNVNAYLNAYSDKFQPEGMGKKAWVEQRKQRVGGKSGSISLVLEGMNIQADAKKASASFVQQYSSGKYSDVVNKVLSLESTSGQWLIVRESVVKAQPAKAVAKPGEAGEMHVKPRDVTADEKSETMPEKLLQESAKQAQQPKPEVKKVPVPEVKPVEPKPTETKPVDAKPVEVPAQTKESAVKAEAQKPPVNRKDAPLPPEDAPDFFERMLEKIGF